MGIFISFISKKTKHLQYKKHNVCTNAPHKTYIDDTKTVHDIEDKYNIHRTPKPSDLCHFLEVLNLVIIPPNNLLTIKEAVLRNFHSLNKCTQL